MNANSRYLPKTYTVVIILCAVVWAMRLVPFLVPQVRLWGCNHLLFAPAGVVYFYAISGVLILLASFLSYKKYLTYFFDSIAGMMSKRRFVLWLAISVLFSLLFWLFRMPTAMLGDGYAVINNIGNDIPVIFKWSEAGAVRIIYYFSLLLPFDGLARGEYAYAITSVLSGGITLFIFFALTYELAEDKSERLFLQAMLLFSGWTLLFFGYAENYPVLWPFMAGYVYAGIRYIKGRLSVIVPLALLFVAVYLHLQFFFFSASFLFLLFVKGAGRKLYMLHTKIVWAIAGILLLSGVGLFIYKYQTSLGFQVHFLPFFFGRTTTPDYAVFSWKHIADILNLWLLLIPVWPILVYLSWKRFRNVFDDPINSFLIFLSIGGLGFIALVDPRLGMARDWDLFALSCLGPALLLARLAAERIRAHSLLAMVSLMAFLIILPYLVVNTSKESSLSYMKYLINLDKPRSRSGLVMLRDYYFNHGDSTRADSVNAVLQSYFPQSAIALQVSDLIDEKEYNRALVLADSIYRMNPYVVDGYNMKGMVYLRLGQFDSAMYNLRQSRELARYEPRTYVHLAELYAKTGKKELMWENLRHAQRLNPNVFSVVQPLAMSFYADGQYDSALVYGRKLIEIRPDFDGGYLVVGLSLTIFKDYKNARRFLVHYLDIAPPSEQRDIAERTLKGIDKRMKPGTQ